MNPTDQSSTPGRRARNGHPTTFPDPSAQIPTQPSTDTPNYWSEMGQGAGQIPSSAGMSQAGSITPIQYNDGGPNVPVHNPWTPAPQNPTFQIPGPMAAGALIPPAGPATPDLQSLLLNRAMGAQAQPTNLTN